jgi:hypothetical protein
VAAAFTFADAPPEVPSRLIDRYDGERWASGWMQQ